MVTFLCSPHPAHVRCIQGFELENKGITEISFSAPHVVKVEWLSSVSILYLSLWDLSTAKTHQMFFLSS